LFLTFAYTFDGVGSGGRPNAAVLLDKPNDAFFLDQDCLHDVYGLVGQS